MDVPIENVDRSDGGADAIASDLGRTTMLRRFDTLYDRARDPHQIFNLYEHEGDPGMREHRDIVDYLHGLTLEWMARFEDPFPTRIEVAAVPDGQIPLTALARGGADWAADTPKRPAADRTPPRQREEPTSESVHIHAVLVLYGPVMSTVHSPRQVGG